jgi:hypothetical protein
MLRTVGEREPAAYRGKALNFGLTNPRFTYQGFGIGLHSGAPGPAAAGRPPKDVVSR